MTKLKNPPAPDENRKVTVHARITKRSKKILDAQAKAEHRTKCGKYSMVLETFADDTGAAS
jgi:Leu/Phe-tRNA-protein transferase